MVARESTVRVVILNAGRSTRLGGRDKLHVMAGGAPVHEWHKRAYADHDVALVTRSDNEPAPGWISRVVQHDAYDGPLGALAAYLGTYDDDKELLVAYADTLIARQDLPGGDWVGVSTLNDHTWDHLDSHGRWVKAVLPIQVGIGLYRFADLELLGACIERLGIHEDSHLPDLLNLYGERQHLRSVTVVGWHDAGDPIRLARVPAYA